MMSRLSSSSMASKREGEREKCWKVKDDGIPIGALSRAATSRPIMLIGKSTPSTKTLSLARCPPSHLDRSLTQGP